MRFMLIQYYGLVEGDCRPMPEWAPEDVTAHIAFQHALNAELQANGEWVDAGGLGAPDQAKFVVCDGVSAPVVTDGPYGEARELLAGYRIVDVPSVERALEIAAKASAAPADGGRPIKQAIEVREMLGAATVD